jgi:hypothetical protein
MAALLTSAPTRYSDDPVIQSPSLSWIRSTPYAVGLKPAPEMYDCTLAALQNVVTTGFLVPTTPSHSRLRRPRPFAGAIGMSRFVPCLRQVSLHCRGISGSCRRFSCCCGTALAAKSTRVKQSQHPVLNRATLRVLSCPRRDAHPSRKGRPRSVYIGQ